MSRAEPTMLHPSPRSWRILFVDHWRVLVALAAVELVGDILGRLLFPWFDPWTNGWIGGALVAPVGFLAGLWWQLASRDRRRKTRLDVLLFVAVLTCGAAPIATVNAISSERHFQARLDAFRALPAGSITRITCYDECGREKLLTIEDPEALGAFARACRDAKGYSPNHPRYWESCYVVIEGEETIELKCHFQQDRADQLVAYFVRKRGDSTRYRGSFISTNLRPWFEKYVENPSREKHHQEADPPGNEQAVVQD
jgi:hypothetical protein